MHQLHTLYDIFPHGVRCVSLARDHSKLRQCVQKRDEMALVLEKVETQLIQKAYLSHSRKTAKALSSETIGTLEPITGSVWKQYLGTIDREKIRLPITRSV